MTKMLRLDIRYNNKILKCIDQSISISHQLLIAQSKEYSQQLVEESTRRCAIFKLKPNSRSNLLNPSHRVVDTLRIV